MIAIFNTFEIKMTKDTAFLCAHQGECLPQVQTCIALNKISRPKSATPERILNELVEYGAWTPDELKDDKTNWEKIVWIAANNIKEKIYSK